MQTKPTFAPELIIPNGVTDVSFYTSVFGATELRRFSNDDGSIHVVELSINGTLFHLHEETSNFSAVRPDKYDSTTVIIGLFVDDVHAVVDRAINAGAEMLSPVQDYDYGYRQGRIKDPFGHHWMIEKAI
ncbi:VOC family protein [Mucilaginibacter sabulilitoris]|uniref:VOC family protein n=1 Tax=Mucilaginibacter sabulilitoris TaxID=1173583 RepID=A0ABZ0TNE3_9SPHI|nr:VOC family protein [Mucilaginibacter sabulilitoris]WPU94452.1 VOC family protein [Mucilaginibacter sabulilitoris]